LKPWQNGFVSLALEDWSDSCLGLYGGEAPVYNLMRDSPPRKVTQAFITWKDGGGGGSLSLRPSGSESVIQRMKMKVREKEKQKETKNKIES
jgi:hypothetical protein